MHMFFTVKFNCKEHAQEIAVNVVRIVIVRADARTIEQTKQCMQRTLARTNGLQLHCLEKQCMLSAV